MIDGILGELEEALRTEAVAAMAAYENGIYQTQHKLDGCLEKLRSVQAAAGQQCQQKVQQIQQEYQHELEQLTQQYESQVRLLEESTKERVTAVHTEMEEIVTQAAAELLCTLQQQQQSACVMQPAVPQPDPHQVAASVCASPDSKQCPASIQQDQHLEQHQQQVQHQPWQQDLKQHRQSWQRLEQEELLLMQHDKNSRQCASHYAASDSSSLAQEATQWQNPAGIATSHTSPSPFAQAPFLSSSAPASVSTSRLCSRHMSIGQSESNRCHQLTRTARGSRHHQQEVQQQPAHLLRALSAVDVLKRAPSSRQQLQEGLLKGLRRASDLSSADTEQAGDSTRRDRYLSAASSSNRQFITGANVRGSTWQDVLGCGGYTSADMQRSWHMKDVQRPASKSAGQLSQSGQRTTQHVGSTWGTSCKLSLKHDGGRAVLNGRKMTQALGLLNDDSD